MTHYHDCYHKDRGCNGRVECDDSNLERNHDGFPEVICRSEILGIRVNYCDDCLESDNCDDCGVPDHLGHDDDCDFWERTASDENIPVEFYEGESE